MRNKIYKRRYKKLRRKIGQNYGFEQYSYINFKVEKGYFFCLYFNYTEVELKVKPMYADDLWWEIWKAEENKKEPLSLRGTGAFAIWGQELTTFECSYTEDMDELERSIEAIFESTDKIIKNFIKENPDANTFYPDESKTIGDRDRLQYLMALIHNGRENEALAIIKQARKSHHDCMFTSGFFEDSYSHIVNWCRKKRWQQRTLAMKKKMIDIAKRIFKIR